MKHCLLVLVGLGFFSTASAASEAKMTIAFHEPASESTVQTIFQKMNSFEVGHGLLATINHKPFSYFQFQFNKDRKQIFSYAVLNHILKLQHADPNDWQNHMIGPVMNPLLQELGAMTLIPELENYIKSEGILLSDSAKRSLMQFIFLLLIQDQLINDSNSLDTWSREDGWSAIVEHAYFLSYSFRHSQERGENLMLALAALLVKYRPTALVVYTVAAGMAAGVVPEYKDKAKYIEQGLITRIQNRNANLRDFMLERISSRFAIGGMMLTVAAVTTWFVLGPSGGPNTYSLSGTFLNLMVWGSGSLLTALLTAPPFFLLGNLIARFKAIRMKLNENTARNFNFSTKNNILRMERLSADSDLSESLSKVVISCRLTFGGLF